MVLGVVVVRHAVDERCCQNGERNSNRDQSAKRAGRLFSRRLVAAFLPVFALLLILLVIFLGFFFFLGILAAFMRQLRAIGGILGSAGRMAVRAVAAACGLRLASALSLCFLLGIVCHDFAFL